MYTILNQKVNKETFDQNYERFTSNPRYARELLDQYNTLLATAPRIYSININSDKCIGNEIYFSRNIIASYNIHKSENISYSSDLHECDNCQDIYKLEFSHRCYDVSSCYKMYHCLFCFNCSELRYCTYCETCYNCESCFGCVGIKNKKYCIFNKQYTAEEYEKLVAQLISHMQENGER